ncbi:MAG: hypothetical protein F7C35_06065 [Desulfurococcales archaeon]|nr:hypothetical protein [Desulfurococcales archaeon]
MVQLAEKFKKYIERLERLFIDGKRSGRVLTLLAVVRLREKGKEITAENVAEEAKRIIRERPDIEWGVTEEQYTVDLAAELLRELARNGVLEEVEGGYVLRKYATLDPQAEILAKFGHLIFYGGPAR